MISVLLRVPVHLGDIADSNGTAVDSRDDGVAHLVQRFITARSLDAEAAAANIDGATRHGRVLTLQSFDDLARRQFQLGHARQIEGDAKFTSRIGPRLGCAHTVDCFENVLQVASLIFQLAIRRVGRHQRELHDVHQAGITLANFQSRDFCRQRWAQRVDLAHYLVIFLFGVGGAVELGEQHRQAIVAERLDFLDVVQLADAVLDGLDHQAFDIARFRAGIRDDDLIDRESGSTGLPGVECSGKTRCRAPPAWRTPPA